MVNIAIVFITAKPDPNFILLVQHFLKADLSIDREGAFPSEYDKCLKILQLTEKNLAHFQKKQADATNNKPSETSQAAQNLTVKSETLYEVIADDIDLLIFDVSKLRQKPKVLAPFLNILEKTHCAILFLNPKHPEFKHLILKYDGLDSSILSFSQLFPEKARKAVSSSLISPLAFKKYQVAAEKHFIRQATASYEALGFIKLPLNSTTDLMKYAVRNKADLLILSKTDLKDLFRTLSDKELLYGRHRISVFFATAPLH